MKTMKLTYVLLTILIFSLLLILSACSQQSSDAKNESPQTGIANPASVYCEENNGTLEIRTDAEGGQYGICTLANGKECEEWAYYRGECKNE